MTTTTHMNAIESARLIAVEFAEQLNGNPAELQNWSQLDRNDDLPNGDYRYLADQFGEVTPEMERAYKSAFNAAINLPQ